MTISPIKWHGGKSYLASKIVDLFPPHLHYVEPFAGGLSVLLARDPQGVSEVVNDLNGELTNFWRVLQNADMFEVFLREIQATPFSECEFDAAEQEFGPSEPIAYAINFFIRCRQSLAGRMKDFATLSRNRVRRGMNEQASAWLTAIEGLPEVHARIKRVVILNRPALDVIRQQDGENTLIYADPPYPHETRTTKGEYGDFEMSNTDHRLLAVALKECTGKVMLSGYDCPLYNDLFPCWVRHEFDLPNNAAGGKTKRRMTEIVWTNF